MNRIQLAMCDVTSTVYTPQKNPDQGKTNPPWRVYFLFMIAQYSGIKNGDMNSKSQGEALRNREFYINLSYNDCDQIT